MNRREFLGVTTLAGIQLLAGGCASSSRSTSTVASKRDVTLKLLPYPQQVTRGDGELRIRKKIERAGSVDEGYDASWLSDDDNRFLRATETSPEASVVIIDKRGVTVVGKGKWGRVYGEQTVNQLIRQARAEGRDSIPYLHIRDWPDMRWRCLSPTLTWYSGWNRLEGYDICNWSEGEWKWLADWSMLHKCNAWAVCMYGYWPFTLPGYENETLSVESDWFNPASGKKEKHRFTHRNIQREFYPEVIRYANERGVKVHAYIGKNSFNGRAFGNNAATNAGGAAEMLPFAPGVQEYWDAFIGRIMEIGFNGFVFEDPEANHVPNQNAQCWETFWKPWAEKYGYTKVEQTDRNNPPLGVHIEYYAWLFRTFDGLIQKHAKRLGKEPEIYLISHFLLARIVNESKTPEEREKWLAMVDEKHGRKVPFIIVEDKEKSYVDMFGGERVASLGGRGGSCTNAMRRIASVNNNWCAGGMGGDLAWERACQKRIKDAGGFGAMGYIFEWTNAEVFAYLAAQHLWKNNGIPGVSNTDQVGILKYAYQLYYGDEVGELAARAMDEGSCVNDAMVLEDVHGSQWPFTGKVLHRDYQFLAVLADRAEALSREAYRKFSGREPELYKAAYDQDAFTWDGYDAAKDKLFKTERLRQLWVSARRSQEMCATALSHRLAQRLIAENAPADEVLKHLDQSIAFAKTNQRIYQLNYDDDYDATDGLCAKITEHLEAQRAAPKMVAEAPVLMIPWEKLTDIAPPASAKTDLHLRTGIGFTTEDDYYRLGIVFSIQLQSGGEWKTIFRRAVHRRNVGWIDCDVPLVDCSIGETVKLRLVTDSYSRAMHRTQPTWKWAQWRQPRLTGPGGDVDLGVPRRLVRLDADGKERPFDQADEDSTGAKFQATPDGVILAFTPHKDGKFGVTIAEFEIRC
jgi:hypothetical protein